MGFTVLAICLGACVGALLRWQLGAHLNSTEIAPGVLIPLGTLTVNVVGGYLIGVCIAVFQALPELDPIWRLTLVTGFLGTLTTFSSFSAEVVGMLLNQRLGLALATVAVHLLGSLTLTAVGIWSANLVLPQLLRH